MNNTPILYLDCTATIRSGLNTGVQRVVRSIINRKELFEHMLGIKCQPICHQYDWYYSLEDALIMTEKTKDSFEKVVPKYLDIYFCIDAYWSYGLYEWFPYFKNRGCTIISIIYDLIPLEHHEFFSQNSIDAFQKATDQVIKYSDIIFTISKSTLDSVGRYTQHLDHMPLIKSFQLSPSEFLQKSSIREHEPSFIFQDYFLTVGTIEPRRGYIRLLEEFENLWSQGYTHPLYIVGKEGENGSLILKKIQKLKENGFFVEWLNNITDDQLVYLYQNAKAIICPSHAEGFGLPLSEAIMFGKPVLANRIPVFGEVAGTYPVYFDIDRCDDLSEKIREFDRHKWFKSYYAFITWNESVRELSKLILEHIHIFQNGRDILTTSNTSSTVVWAYKLFYGKSVDEDTLDFWLKECKTFEEFRERILFEVVSSDSITPQAISWAYKLFYGKSVDDEALRFWLSKCQNVEELRQHFLYELKNSIE